MAGRPLRRAKLMIRRYIRQNPEEPISASTFIAAQGDEIASVLKKEARKRRIKVAQAIEDLEQDISMALWEVQEAEGSKTPFEWKKLLPGLIVARLKVLQGSYDPLIRAESGVVRGVGLHESAAADIGWEDLLAARDPARAAAAGMYAPKTPEQEVERKDSQDELEAYWSYVVGLRDPLEKTAVLLLFSETVAGLIARLSSNAKEFENRATEAEEEAAERAEEGESLLARGALKRADRRRAQAREIFDEVAGPANALRAAKPPRGHFNLGKPDERGYPPRAVARFLGIDLSTLALYETRLKRAIRAYRERPPAPRRRR